MRLFKHNKKYKIVLELNGEISYFTAKIIDEDDTHFKFEDKFGEELVKSKDTIKSVKELK